MHKINKQSATVINTTMVDKIPWDTCAIALIFCVFKTEFLKKHCYPFQNTLLPPLPQYNVETLEK